MINTFNFYSQADIVPFGNIRISNISETNVLYVNIDYSIITEFGNIGYSIARVIDALEKEFNFKIGTAWNPWWIILPDEKFFYLTLQLKDLPGQRKIIIPYET
jgi:hypothetical protein